MEKINTNIILVTGGDFNKVTLSIDFGKCKHNSGSHYSYNVEFELFRIVREDQFELLKDPRRLFQERMKVNDAKTEEAIRKRFKEEHNRITSDLPLNGHFDTEIDNELYEHHAKTATDQSAFHSLDFEQNIANTYTSVYYSPSYPDLLFPILPRFLFFIFFPHEASCDHEQCKLHEACGEPTEHPLALAGHLRDRFGALALQNACTCTTPLSPVDQD